MIRNPTKVSLKWRRTKIIATLGPATAHPHMVEKLIRDGVNVFRLNMSHGDHEQHKSNFKLIRDASLKTNQNVAILVDLCGPKIRTGSFPEGSITLKRNSQVNIVCNLKDYSEGDIRSQYSNLYRDVKRGERILLDDGNLELKVTGVIEKRISCKVVHGGILKDNKGINLPDSDLSVSSLTKKDKRDVDFAQKMCADFIALSFVRDADAVISLQRYMTKHGEPIPVIAKIEKPEAISNIDSILEASYGIMIARGDLGIELPAEEVPLIQKDLITRARKLNRPVIVATQMLESMIESSRPTRAEVGDVANAALLGTDAVMLSAETASGKYPLQAVKMMDRVLREIEAHQWKEDEFGHSELDMGISMTFPIRKAISHAVTSLASDLKLQGIVVPTTTGTTAAVLAADRPSAPLLGISSSEGVCRKLSLHWGVIPIKVDRGDTNNWKKLSIKLSKQCALTSTGNTVLLVSGFSDDPSRNEPAMKILRV